MRLKRLEVSGFKSFAKKTVLTFDARITGIVGPNGSGKSNVAEAFRFALGEQSLKSLRGKKGEDLIFNGGSGLSRQNRAQALLAFDNTSRVLPLDFDEVTIERVVHRDGLNEYFINGSRVRLKDITELLAHANIGASGHHIISQGEADRILSAQPAERREMIEDALGLRVFQYRKRESEKKLDKTLENMRQVEALRKEVIPHLSFLRKQVEKLQKAEALRISIREAALAYFSTESGRLDHERARIVAEREQPERTLAGLADEYKALDIHIRDEQQRIKMAGEEQGLINELRAKRATLEAEIRDIQSTIDRAMGEISMLSRLVRQEEDKLHRDQDSEVTFKRAALRETVRTIEALCERVKHAQGTDERATLVSQIQKSLETLHDAVKEVQPSQALIQYKDDVSRKMIDVESLKTQVARLHAEFTALNDRITHEQQLFNNAMGEVASARERLLTLKEEMNATAARLQTLHAEMVRIDEAKALFDQDLMEFGHMLGPEFLRLLKEKAHTDAQIQEGSESNQQLVSRKDLERMKIRLEDMQVSGGDEVMKEFGDVSARDEFLARELGDLDKAHASLVGVISELETEMSRRFDEGMLKINTTFNQFFSTMFDGGSAALVLETVKSASPDADDDESHIEVEEEDTKSVGVEVKVSLPRKRVHSLAMLSGGERALTSIALLFALSQVTPPPFIILDETDAALDESNSRKYGDMIEALGKHSQLLLITHNRETMSRAGVLYGVTMSRDGASTILSVRFEDALAVAK